MEKVTKKQNFEALLALDEVASNEALTDFIKHEIELLAKRKTSHKVNAETEALKETVLDVLDGQMTTTEICKAVGDDISTQKMSPILKALVAEGKVVKTEAKGKHKATFAIA